MTAAMVLFRTMEKIDLRPGVPCAQAIDKRELPNYPDLRGGRPQWRALGTERFPVL